MQNHTQHQAVLETALQEIITELETIAVQSPDSGDWVAVPAAGENGNADSNLEADVVEEWNERRAILSQLETRYRNIVRALDNISKGSYGKCEICGAPIEEERLQVNPAARTDLAHMDREKELSI